MWLDSKYAFASVTQPEFLQGGEVQSVLNNTAQLQWQNPQDLVTIRISMFFSPGNERCVRFLTERKEI